MHVRPQLIEISTNGSAARRRSSLPLSQSKGGAVKSASWAVLALTIALLAGCGGDNSAAPTPQAPPTESSTGGVPFDLAFIDAMVPHHRDAIEMANAALERGLTQPELETIAENIRSTQQLEIDEMLRWRQSWYGTPELGPIRPEVLGVAEDEMGMIGMEHSADEISSADDVDGTFAKLMLPHHEGAVAMARAAKERAQHEEIRKLADAIVDAQELEIIALRLHAAADHHTP